MHKPLLLYGLLIWAAATVALRLAGQHLLHPGNAIATLMLFAVSFVAMAALARRLCQRFQLPPDHWLAGALSLCLPTLLLDPFSCAFFPVLFPNMSPQVAGTFGGWMFICCAGALLGAAVKPARPPSNP